MNRDGSGRSRIVPYPIGNVFYMSPDRRWITTMGTMPNGITGTFAVPVAGGSPQRICSGCVIKWAPDGKFLYMSLQRPSLTELGKTRVIPLPPGKMFPALPPSGMLGIDDAQLIPGSRLIDTYGISPSPNPSVYAYVKTTMHRNLFRIPVL